MWNSKKKKIITIINKQINKVVKKIISTKAKYSIIITMMGIDSQTDNILLTLPMKWDAL